MTRKDRTEGIYNRREVLDENERRQYCLIQLKDLLSYAYRYSEDVKKRFDRAQFNVEKFKTLSDIKHIPLLKKKELIFLQNTGICQCVEQRGLARAGGAEDAEDFTRIDGQVNVVQHLMRFGATAVAFVQMVDLNRHNVLFLLMFHNKNAAG